MADTPVTAWRRLQRERLIKERQQLSLQQRQLWQLQVRDHLQPLFAELAVTSLGFYWPIRGEPDCRNFVAECCAEGWTAALPVIQGPGKPLLFRLWTPESPMEIGPWDIPVPRRGEIIEPDVLLIPLVGFDDAGYRLGYGGGFYDRTLASIGSRPLSIGLGIEAALLESTQPQPHDVRLDLIITESQRRDYRI